MACWNPSALPFFKLDTSVGLGRCACLSGVAFLTLGLCMGVNGCGGHMPGAPTDARLLTISGYVYAVGTAGSGEPALTEVLITVQDVGSAPHTTMTDGVGFYTLIVRAGNISITASKAGYAARASIFDISNTTVLNFSLTPS